MVLMLSHPLESAKFGIEGFLKDGVISRGDILMLFIPDKPCQGLIDEAEVVIPKSLIQSWPRKHSHVIRAYT